MTNHARQSVRGLCIRPGCTGSTETKYCSKRCIAIARLCAGWEPWKALFKHPAERLAACRRGAATTHARRRREHEAVMTTKIAALLMELGGAPLSTEQRRSMVVLLTKARRLGKAEGYAMGWNAKQAERRKVA